MASTTSRTPRKRNLVIASVAALALAGGGTAFAVAGTGGGGGSDRAADTSPAGAPAAGDDDGDRDDRDDRDDDQDRDDDRDRAGDDRDDTPRNAEGVKLSVAEAVRAALEKHRGTADSAELESEASGPVWEVGVLGGQGTSYEVRIDAGSGKVLGSTEDRETEADDRAEDEAERKTIAGAGTDLGGAAEAALKKAPGTVTSVEFEDADDDGTDADDRDRAVGRDGAWEVEVLGKDGTTRDLLVDAGNGKVTAAPGGNG
ncbi:PepSY domain-containing protein [Streptomyces zingiberis]|uniref:Peptidase propeptide and YpeB domain protein n=1 Tax=Streptomyces zingiberis TaxID=2053010 RepID=A0ABX1BSU7_9ACTN|nr:PepSY domain-containing protein [Streptomyces zingiberis]NJQ00782.1 peptidase propeptide and YpeB domain protein [Streptomyces zingiberis]